MTIRSIFGAAALAGAFLVAVPARAGIFQIWTETVQLEADIRPGFESSGPSWLAVYDETLYFSAKGDAQGKELWKYNGSSAIRVSDISPGSGDSFPSGLTVYDGALYFSASDSPLNGELWRYDGSNAALAAEIQPGPVGSYPEELTVYDGALYFSAIAGGGGRQLWRYGGETAAIVPGTEALREVQELTIHDGYLWFLARKPGEGFGRIWRTDGQDTQSIALIDSKNFLLRPELVSAGADLYASLSHSNYGLELWRVTTNGLIVEDLYPGENSTYPTKLTWFNNKLYMSGQIYEPGFGNLYGFELVRFDGTTAELVEDINPYVYGNSYPANMTPFLNSLYFSADILSGTESVWTGRELYRHDPANDTTILLEDINESESGQSNGSSSPGWFTHAPPAVLYFSAHDGVNGRELWSVRRTFGRLHVLLYPKWTPEEMVNPWEWQIAVETENIEADVAMAAFLLTNDGRARLFETLDLKLPRGKARTDRVITGHGTGDESGIVTLAVAVFDKQRGDLIGIETVSVGIDERGNERQQAGINRRAASILEPLSLRAIQQIEPGSILAAPGRVAPPREDMAE